MRVVRAAAAACVAVALVTIAAPSAFAADHLAAEGDSWPIPVVTKLQNDTASAVAPFVNVFTDVGEGASLTRLATGDNDYAVTSVTLSPSDQQTAAGGGRQVAYTPYMAGGVALAIALDLNGGGRLPHLFLTVPTLAKLFTHRITQWNHPEIKAENPPDIGANLENVTQVPVEFAALATSSGSTRALIALFLADPVARPIWNDYASALGAQPDVALDVWPHDPDNKAHLFTSGSKGMVDFMLAIDPQTGERYRAVTSHYIGYLAPAWTENCAGFCHENTPTVTLTKDAARTETVDSTPDAVSKALAKATVDPATNVVTPKYGLDANGPGAWPAIVVSHLAVPTKGLTAQGKPAALAAFMRFTLGDAGQKDVSDSGYVPVSNDVRQAGLKVADAVAAQGSSSTATAAPVSSPSGSTAPAPPPTGGPSAVLPPRNGNELAAAAARGGAGQTSGGGGAEPPTLPKTGGGPAWPLAMVAFGFLVVGEVVRRRSMPRVHLESTERLLPR